MFTARTCRLTVFMRRAAVIAAAAAGVAVPQASARPVTRQAATACQSHPASYGYITNANSKKVLDVYHSSTADYANVDQYECNGTGAELWKIGITNGHRYFANFTSQKAWRCTTPRWPTTRTSTSTTSTPRPPSNGTATSSRVIRPDPACPK